MQPRKLSNLSRNLIISDLIKFYNTLGGNDTWSVNWDIYDNQENAQTSDALLGLPDAQLKFDDDDYLLEMNLTKIGLEGKIPGDIESLTKLESLILQDNNIEGFADDFNFNGNAALTTIDLSLNKIKEVIGQFPTQLETLNMKNNSIKMPISDFLDLVTRDSIKSLYLSGNKFNESMEDDDILQSNSLTTLDVAGNQITGNLLNLKTDGWEKIDISHNLFNGDFPPVLIDLIISETANARCNMFNCAR